VGGKLGDYVCTRRLRRPSVGLLGLHAGFSIDLNFQDVMTSELKNLDVSVQNLEVMQQAYNKTLAKINIMQKIYS